MRKPLVRKTTARHMMISNPIETTSKPAAGLDAAMLRTLEEKGLIRRQTDPQTGRSTHESVHGPSVWTGRALQAESDDLEVMGPALLYPALDGTFEFLAIMDIRARSISFASRPRRP